MSTLQATEPRPPSVLTDDEDPSLAGDRALGILVTDPMLMDELLAHRQESGGDRYDEVWDGVYVMSPLANVGHQRFVTQFAFVLETVVGVPGLGDVCAGVNVSDRERGWLANFRCPDVAVRLHGGRSRNCKTHWVGGPDFAIEIVSQRDRSRAKLAFYASIGTRELLIVDRDPWALELYGLRGEHLVPIGISRPESPATIASEVLPLSFRLIPAEPTPQIEVVHLPDGQRWTF